MTCSEDAARVLPPPTRVLVVDDDLLPLRAVARPAGEGGDRDDDALLPEIDGRPGPAPLLDAAALARIIDAVLEAAQAAPRA